MIWRFNNPFSQKKVEILYLLSLDNQGSWLGNVFNVFSGDSAQAASVVLATSLRGK